MARRVVVFPRDDVTAGVWRFLQTRYTPAEAAERRARLKVTIERLISRGKDRRQLHRGLQVACRLRSLEDVERVTYAEIRKHRTAVTRARRDLARAMASLRRFIPAEAQRHFSDDDVFSFRDVLLAEGRKIQAASRRGRPFAHWHHAADVALQHAGISATDRRELLAALGMRPDD